MAFEYSMYKSYTKYVKFNTWAQIYLQYKARRRFRRLSLQEMGFQGWILEK